MRQPPPSAQRLAGLLVLFLLGFSLASVPVVRAAADLPVWSVGDSWTYIGQGFEAPIGSGTIRYVVVGMDDVPLSEGNVSAYHLEIWANQTGANASHVADEWYRVSDLAVVRLRLDRSICPAGSVLGCSNSTVTSTLDPLLPLHFPLASGDRWSANTTVATEILDTGSGLADWFNYPGGTSDRVGVNEQVSVPAGSFAATPLTELFSGNAVILSMSYAAETVRDFSPLVGNAVEVRDYSSSSSTGVPGPPSGSMVLVAYVYAAPTLWAQLLGEPAAPWLVVAAAVVAGSVVAVQWGRRRKRAPPAP